MRWLRLTLRVPAALEDEVAVCLHEEGSVGIEAKAGVSLAWFPQEADADAIQRRVRHALSDIPGADGIALDSADIVEDGYWHERWVAGLKPIPAGESFLIVPGPIAPPADTGRKVIRLTPGRAFGTGEHVTTRLCLALMERAGVSGSGLLDVGTGSGILAIAARLSGAAPVVAVDVDPEAVRVARRNVALNDAGPVGLLAGSTAALVGATFAIVVANLNGPTLLRLLGDLSRLTGRWLILSGVLNEEAEEVIGAARQAGFTLVDRRDDGDWIGLLLAQRGS